MSIKTKMILVVDDDPEVAETFRFALTRKGYEVAVAGNGNQALALVDSCQPDAIVLDLMLPKRSGFFGAGIVTAQFGGFQWWWSRPMKANAIGSIAELLGIHRYLCKPVSVEELLSAVAECVQDNTELDNTEEDGVDAS